MTATTHLLSGAALATFLPLPVAIPLAYASHFVLDSLPHFDIQDQVKEKKLKDFVLTVDTLSALVISITLLSTGHWALFLCGFLAFMPDIPHIIYFFTHNHKTHIERPANRFEAWHLQIQRFHSKPGILSEIVLSIVFGWLIIKNN